MTTMSEYAALHGWEVGAQLRYKDSATPSTITGDAYDTLTRPWGEVIGPIHPDDDDWSGDA